MNNFPAQYESEFQRDKIHAVAAVGLVRLCQCKSIYVANKSPGFIY